MKAGLIAASVAVFTQDCWGFSEINPSFKANKTTSALLRRLNASRIWCLWNSTVFSLMSRTPAISLLGRPSANS